MKSSIAKYTVTHLLQVQNKLAIFQLYLYTLSCMHKSHFGYLYRAWISTRISESIRAVIRAIPLLRESKLIRVSDTMI